MAETYNIYDMESLPALKVATYVCGLRSDSRIKLKMSGLKYDINTVLLAVLIDRLSNIKDESKLITPKFLTIENDSKTDSEIISFSSVEEYKKAMQEFNSKFMED